MAGLCHPCTHTREAHLQVDCPVMGRGLSQCERVCGGVKTRLNPTVHFWLHDTVHCVEKLLSLHTGTQVHGGCFDWLSRAVVETGGGNSHPGCMDRLRKHYSHLIGGSFEARKGAWALSGCMTTEW